MVIAISSSNLHEVLMDDYVLLPMLTELIIPTLGGRSLLISTRSVGEARRADTLLGRYRTTVSAVQTGE